MSDYRIYCVDSEGRIGLADWIQADSDEEAVLKARELKPNRRQCEIWHKDRLVGRLTFEGRFEAGQ